MRRARRILIAYLLTSVVGCLFLGWLIRRGRNAWEEYEYVVLDDQGFVIDPPAPPWRPGASEWAMRGFDS